MKVAIILGNRMNDDGTISETMKKRLELTLELYKELKPDKIIVSGGIANRIANVSEASKMEEYLINKGISKDLIIQENESHTTRENALFSVPIALGLNADTIIICSTIEHFTKVPYNTVKFFSDELKDKKVKLMIYTNNE